MILLMSNKLLPVSAIAVYRYISSNSEVVVSAPRVTIRSSNGQLKTLYSTENGANMVQNPFTAPDNGQWLVWTKAEMDPITINLEKGNASVTVPMFLTPSTEMIVSTNSPLADPANSYLGYTPDYVGQDYLHEVDDGMGNITRRLYKSHGQTASEWLELQLVTP